MSRIGNWMVAAALAACAAQVSASDLARAEEIVMGQCFVCHGADGESSSPIFPRLAGQNAGYVARQLADYKSGRRRNTTMQPLVADLSERDFAALGAWYASRPTHAHPVGDPAQAAIGRQVYHQGNVPEGVPACVGCHGPTGQGSEALPRLAGQHALYVENQLRKFHERERTNDNAVMHLIASKLTGEQMRAVAVYLSGMK